MGDELARRFYISPYGDQDSLNFALALAQRFGYKVVVTHHTMVQLVLEGESVPPPAPPPVTPPPSPPPVPPPSTNWWETLAVGQRLRVTRVGGAPVYYDPPSEKEGAVERERKPQGDTSMTVYRGDDGLTAHGTYIMVFKWPPYNLWVSKFDVEVV